mmetsp:Transcript_86651/g.240274  ORF Transcript_86651/g.240274 Transcript_86651/m.240274 type:complete len:181 (+) Transcript_86651:164-706(+)
MRPLLLAGLLERAGGLLAALPAAPAAAPHVIFAPLAVQAWKAQAGPAGLSQFDGPLVAELDPRYRFICVWRQHLPNTFLGVGQAMMSARLTQREEPETSGSDATRADNELYMDPCVLGLTKLTWACVLTGFSLIVIILCIPFLLVISRRRPPGQPLFDCCDGCCETKRQPLPPTLQFVQH